MNASIVWKMPRSAISNNFSGLLDKLVEKYGMVDLDQAGFQAFMDAPDNGVVLLTEEPDTVAESWDMAVIFPELLVATGINWRAAVMRPGSAKVLQTRFGVGRLPALLFLRDGGYVGAIEGLRDWPDFVAECAAMLQKSVSRVPMIGVPVSVASSSSCH